MLEDWLFFLCSVKMYEGVIIITHSKRGKTNKQTNKQKKKNIEYMPWSKECPYPPSWSDAHWCRLSPLSRSDTTDARTTRRCLGSCLTAPPLKASFSFCSSKYTFLFLLGCWKKKKKEERKRKNEQKNQYIHRSLSWLLNWLSFSLLWFSENQITLFYVVVLLFSKVYSINIIFFFMCVCVCVCALSDFVPS